MTSALAGPRRRRPPTRSSTRRGPARAAAAAATWSAAPDRPRQIDVERRAVTELAVDADGAAAARHDAVDGRQPQAGALARLLRGEERLEQTRLHVGRHARPGIGHATAPRTPQASPRSGSLRSARRARHRRSRSSACRHSAWHRGHSPRDSSRPAPVVRDRPCTGARPGWSCATIADVLADQTTEQRPSSPRRPR